MKYFRALNKQRSELFTVTEEHSKELDLSIWQIVFECDKFGFRI
jgi:hypothetical protein